MGLFDIFSQERKTLEREVNSAVESLIHNAIQLIKQFALRIIRGVLNFFRDVVNRFKKMNLSGTQFPFLTTKQEIEPLLENANVPYSPTAVFSAVYDERTDEVVMGEYVGADSLDADTKNTLKGHKLRVLN